jgi:hypothetical protein
VILLRCDSTLRIPHNDGGGGGGGAVASAGCGSGTSQMRCGIKVDGGGADTALPQVLFNIAQAYNCMIECKGEARWCTGDKNTQ